MANEYYAYNLIKSLYYPERNDLRNEKDILENFSYKNTIEKNMGNLIEMPDRLANINGNHIYKLLSSKDIDWENAFLPNTVVPDENWGSFDETRRWPSNTPIHVNDVYELMNLVDYLFCACEDLWSEVNKLKYGDGANNKIWFIVNCTQPLGLSESNRLTSDAFKKNSLITTQNIKKINLTPLKYFATITDSQSTEGISLDNFGMSTLFHVTAGEDAHDKKIVRYFDREWGRRGLVANVVPGEKESISMASSQINQNGSIVSIYGYQIGDDLHFYPGYNINNFFKRNSQATDIGGLVTDPSRIVDTTNHKLLYEDVYFRTSQTSYSKVYIEFLYNFKPAKSNHPYILYYKDTNIKRKVVIYYTKEKVSGTNELGQAITYDPSDVENLFNNVLNVLDKKYYVNGFGAGQTLFDIMENSNLIFTNSSGNIKDAIPVLYVTSDEFSAVLRVATPKSILFNDTKTGIQLYYYKGENKLNVEVKTVPEDKNKNIKPNIDLQQANSTLYNPSRYNIPDTREVYITSYANYIAGENENPLGLKIDDEYIDRLILSSETGDAENNYSNYYVGTENVNDAGKRQFTNFTSPAQLHSFFQDQSNQMIDYGTNSTCFQLYEKIKNPYNLLYEVNANSLIKQDLAYNINRPNEMDVNKIVSYIRDNCIEKISYRDIKFSYKLPQDIEQVKFDINLRINETSKVKEISYNIPINLNKIHYPWIHYVNSQDIDFEICEYNRTKDIYNEETQSTEFNSYVYKYNLDYDDRVGNIIPNGITYLGNIYSDPTTLSTLNNGKPKSNYGRISGLIDNNGKLTSVQNYNYTNQTNSRNFVDMVIDIFQKDLINANDFVNEYNTKIYNEFPKKLPTTNQFINNGIYHNLPDELIFYDKGNYYNGNNVFNSNVNTQNTIPLCITYSSTQKYVNLFGGDILTYVIPNNTRKFSHISTRYQLEGQESSSNAGVESNTCIFNINGLGANYRLHSGDKNYNQNYNQSNYSKYYSLLSNATLNSENNLAYFLAISLDDSGSDSENLKEHKQIQLSYISNYNGNNPSEYKLNHGEFIYGSYFNIDSIPLRIIKGSHKFDMPADSISFSATMSYYVSYTYMEVKSSTFYPPEDTKPKTWKRASSIDTTYTYMYDFNKPADVNDMGRYIACWDNLSNYHPITMKLQLKENYYRNTPFFAESNVATMKFNIVRKSTDNVPQFSGNTNPSMVCPNMKYYLSDFIIGNIIKNENNSISVISGNELLESLSIGSYFNYNTNTKLYDVIEIYNNRTNLNERYLDPSKYGQTNGIITPFIIPYKEVKENDEIKLNYDYNIGRVAEINKLLIKGISIDYKTADNNTISQQLIFNDEGISPGEEISIYENDVNEDSELILKFDPTLYTITFGDKFFDKYFNRVDSNAITTDSCNIKFIFDMSTALRSNKNFMKRPLTTENAGTNILPVYRYIAPNKTSYGGFPPMVINNTYFDVLDFKGRKDLYYYNSTNYEVSISYYGYSNGETTVDYNTLVSRFNMNSLYTLNELENYWNDLPKGDEKTALGKNLTQLSQNMSFRNILGNEKSEIIIEE